MWKAVEKGVTCIYARCDKGVHQPQGGSFSQVAAYLADLSNAKHSTLADIGHMITHTEGGIHDNAEIPHFS